MKIQLIKNIKNNYLYIILFVLFIILGIYIIYNIQSIEEGLANNLSINFCKKYEGKTSELDVACNKLTTKNCKSSNCCVFVNNNKCSAGNSDGPTYKTDSNGNKIQIDNYYYQNKYFTNNK